jgi:hypothetical protein
LKSCRRRRGERLKALPIGALRSNELPHHEGAPAASRPSIRRISACTPAARLAAT